MCERYHEQMKALPDGSVFILAPVPVVLEDPLGNTAKYLPLIGVVDGGKHYMLLSEVSSEPDPEEVSVIIGQFDPDDPTSLRAVDGATFQRLFPIFSDAARSLLQEARETSAASEQEQAL